MPESLAVGEQIPARAVYLQRAAAPRNFTLRLELDVLIDPVICIAIFCNPNCALGQSEEPRKSACTTASWISSSCTCVSFRQRLFELWLLPAAQGN